MARKKRFLSYTEWRKHFPKQRLRVYTAKYWHTRYEVYKAKKITGDYIKEAEKEGYTAPRNVKNILRRLEKAEATPTRSGRAPTTAEILKRQAQQLEYLKKDRFYQALEKGLTKEQKTDWLAVDEYYELLNEIRAYGIRYPVWALDEFKRENAGEVGTYQGTGRMDLLAAQIVDAKEAEMAEVDEYRANLSDEMYNGMSF